MIGLQACINHAASGYHVPATYIESVMEAKHPSDGIGLMGIPPSWLPTLARFGFNVGKVLDDNCANIDAGAWIIAANPKAEVSSSPEGNPSTPLPECAVNAENAYRVPDRAVRGILQATHPASAYGPMGIPSAWIPLLTAYGFDPFMVEHDTCTGLIAGIWILGVERLNGYVSGAGEQGGAPKYSPEPPSGLTPIFERAAQRYSIPIDLLYAVTAQESGFKSNVVSSAGAMGLMQLMPKTAEHYQVTNAYDPEQNIMAGAAYLADLKIQFEGNIQLMLAAYNAGSGAVLAYGGKIPPYAETQFYVPAVMGRLSYYDHKFPQGRS